MPLNDSKDFYGAQAFGDPYGEYELNRAPGQPDLDLAEAMFGS